MTTTAGEVVRFWRQAGMQAWFNGGEAFDRECETRFLAAHLVAARRGHEDWLDSADGALALLVLLDQIPRNVFRGSGHAFATDGLARHYADRVLAAGHDTAFEPDLRAFFYLPFEHSEELADQQRSVELFRPLGNEVYLKYAIEHQEVIARFGRFPHRNRALGRESTPAEQAWLDAGGGF
ncbi:DUF924 family protein [Pseudoxanthomonas suwonensis]|uniref:DUF924 domain-containing protein n=1 Tax=Pseudoxanthomonas suwonensis TaxID=314722 RepID=A0A0E3Z5W5_9GAMM|nr:DUF924 family protein [Pseudoxanthomonas suwonensis]AKC88324.1 hypothetical protein WQ53_09705 [Pseudoxanthomonas suwonensis]